MKLSEVQMRILQGIVAKIQQGERLQTEGQAEAVEFIKQCAEILKVDYPAAFDFINDSFVPKPPPKE